MKKTAAKVCLVSLIISVVSMWQAQYQTDPSQLPEPVKAAMVSKAGNPLRFSTKALEIIGDAESCRKDAYQCPARVWTAGIGHTKGVKPNMKDVPIETIALWFVQDTMDAQNCIEQNIERPPLMKLPQGVFDGIGSFTFNAGCKNLINSSMAKLLMAGQYIKACMELPRWNKAAGKVLQGLVIRRGKEKDLCLDGLQN